MKPFNVSPFALPNCGPGEVRFEETRNIKSVVVTFKKNAPRAVGISYLRNTWPEPRIEEVGDTERPFQFGWKHMDDWFNCAWCKASIRTKRLNPRKLDIAFNGLTHEFPKLKQYDATFRRTLGIRIDVSDPSNIENIEIHSLSRPVRSTLRVELDAGRRTPGRTVRLEGYNAVVRKISPVSGVTAGRDKLALRKTGKRVFEVALDHMQPESKYWKDDGHVRLVMDRDAFTISLPAIEQDGPVWFAEYGFFIKRTDDPTTFDQYRTACRGRETVAEMVQNRHEQTYRGAFNGQPHPHAVAYSLGCKHARQRFWLESNGDVVLTKQNVKYVAGRDTPRYANEGDGRFFFGLENWPVLGRYPEPAPVVAYNIRLRRSGLELDQKSFAVPLERSILKDKPAGDESIVCMLRFRFLNTGTSAVIAELPIKYSGDSGRTTGRGANWSLPKAGLEQLKAKGNRVYGTWKGEPALRCEVDSSMGMRTKDGVVVLSKRLQPGESCNAVLKIPFVRLDTPAELRALEGLNFDRALREVARFWHREGQKGAQLVTPIQQLTDLHGAHLSYVQITDFAMPDEPHLINTSVGTSTYGNFSNESCMINQELDQRGFTEDARRRLEIWVKYQGTVALPGNFTDYDGMYYGAGGFESGEYNQHHGWVLWRLCQHFLLTGDKTWFAGVLDSVIDGAEWVFRQRRNTMQNLPHSRGWERGFLPAGSLEDVTDFYYWLSTNALTWRGCDICASALEEFGHPEAARVRKEADAYGRDLRKGFENMRSYSPLVRLRNGRWVPHYPSRLYCRGRDQGWIREVLEGSVYLFISGLFSPTSRQARWILDDYQDNRYMSPPYGYAIMDEILDWFSRGGFSMQPNLLAGLMPYLDRDEPEIYIWMFFNAWCACYREEISAMVEHPSPDLGYSNTAHPKTSDEANAVMWLRYMIVYVRGGLLHYGRAIPRAWFADGETVALSGLVTRFGATGITYVSQAAKKRIAATVSLPRRKTPRSILVRFRHPDKKPIKRVKVNGKLWKRFCVRKHDVDITGLSGKVRIEVVY